MASPNSDSYVSEFIEKIRSRKNSDFFETDDRSKLHYLKFSSNASTSDLPVFIFPGMGEPVIKYWDIGETIAGWGRDVFILDHLGHGFSDHPLGVKGVSKVHIDDFSIYTNHAKQWVREVKKSRDIERLVFLGHSMGGLIAQLVSVEIKTEKLILSCPMFGIHTKGVPLPFAKLLAKVLPGEMLAPLQEEFNQSDLSKNKVTQSQNRADLLNKIFETYPYIKKKGVTNRWIRTSLEQTSRISTSLVKSGIETLIFTAGKDTFVKTQKTQKVGASLGAKVIHFPDAKHEVLMEKDEIRDKVLRDMKEFMEK